MIAIVGVGVLGTRVLKRIPEDEEVLIIDHDFVREENIHRQYPVDFLGSPKAEAAKHAFHPLALAVSKHLDITTAGLLEEASVVIDCTDNLLSRRIINDVCSKFGIPWIHGALSDSLGTVALFTPGGPCFSCLYPENTGEICTRNLPLALADKTADAIISQLKRLQNNEPGRFVRVTLNGESIFGMIKRKGCRTCAGEYPFLAHPQRGFYITFCTSSNCMAAKPAVPRRHDHGSGEEQMIENMPLTIYPNGEIHFHAEASEDELYRIASKVYANVKK